MSNQLPTQYQQFIHLSRYSRWLEEEGRRETWGETIERYFNFFEGHLKEMWDYVLDSNTKEELESARIASQEQIAGAKIGIDIAKETMGDLK